MHNLFVLYNESHWENCRSGSKSAESMYYVTVYVRDLVVLRKGTSKVFRDQWANIEGLANRV